jgi:hypothetical protein
MSDQITLFGENIPAKRSRSAEQKAKRNFLARFQRWSDKRADDPTTSEGKCGYGKPCDYCVNDSPNPCSRALNRMIKETGVTINYETAEPSDVW